MFAHRTGRKALATLASGLLMTVVIYVGPAAAAPVRYEAENATISQGLVESNHANFSGTGFVNTDPVVGSYVEWTVNSTIAGTATFGIRFANGSTASRPADVAVNGTTVASALAFQSTGAWATWATKTVTASVNAGSNTIRVSSSAASGGPNLDYVDFEPPQSFTDYQAENALISRGVVESNWPGYTGTGFVNGDNVVGSYVEFTVSVATSGIYPVTFRHSHGSGVNRPMDISVNGAVAAPALAFPRPPPGTPGPTSASRSASPPVRTPSGRRRRPPTAARTSTGCGWTAPPTSSRPPGQAICVWSARCARTASISPGTRRRTTSVSRSTRSTTAGTSSRRRVATSRRSPSTCSPTPTTC
ncbi:hypothetical protein GCM10027614_19850 [Micromonospora vulcania]